MENFRGCKSVYEIKKLYRKLALQHHPDMGGSAPAMQNLAHNYKEALQWAAAAGLPRSPAKDAPAETPRQEEPQYEGSAEIELREEQNYLDGLSPEQLSGYANFEKWLNGSKPAAALVGRGGTGKTFSVGRYCLEYGLDPSKVLGVAPTNAAAKKLESDLWAAGFNAACTTAHKALNMRPEPQKWTDRDDEALATVEAKLTRFDIEGCPDFELRRIAEVERSRLHRKLDCFRKDVLLFTVAEQSGEPQPLYDLYIVDESSMTGAEIWELIMLEWSGSSRILFMGDPLQMRPVGESLSKSFSVPWLIEFADSRRAKGDLKKLHEAIASCNNPNTSAEILRNLPYWDDYGIDNPWELPEDSACLIRRKESKLLWHHFLTMLPFDGLSFRMIGFRNKTVDQMNSACLKMLGVQCPQRGHTIVANSPLNRTGPGREQWESVRIAHSSELLEVVQGGETTTAYAPGFGDFTVTKIKVIGTDSLGDMSPLCQPGAFLGGWEPDSHDVLRWTNDPIYQEALEFWSALKSSLYCKGKPPLPSANANVAQFFEMIGADSWCNFVGIKGVKTYQPPKTSLDFSLFLKGSSAKEREKFLRNCFDHEGRAKFSEIRKYIYRLYKWLQQGAVDDAKPLGASTVYKAQGQTIANVGVLLEELLESQRFGGTDAVANCQSAIYTAVSRSSKRLYVVV